MSGISANGIILKFGTSATPTDVVADQDSAGLDLGKLLLLDITPHGATREKKVSSGIRSLPQIPFTLLYQPANTGHEAIRAAHAAGTLCYLTIVLPDAGAAEWALTGHVTEFNVVPAGPRDPLKANVVFEATLGETFTA